ncbi:MAG TPA: PIN domain-containing protein [Candidatus Acidoferrum sp.]|jgi:predicted nucleic acid-binding protein
MRVVFADTSYWIAFLNPRDGLHAKAIALSQQVATSRIVTSEMVLAELLNSFSAAGPGLRSSAVRTVEALLGSHSVVVFPQTSEQFARALQRYKQSEDKGWSLTDCASFQIMETERIRAALTHDLHFAQAGYEALLR